MAPSRACHRQPSFLRRSYSIKPICHSFRKTPALVHSWNHRCAEELEQMPVAFKAFHWQPVRNAKKMPFMALRGSTAGL